MKSLLLGLLDLLSAVEIKVSLTGLSQFKEGIQQLRMLSLRKGINCNLHLQGIKMD